MDAVGDVADVHLLGRVTGEELGEHLLANQSVELGDTINLLRESDGEVGHIEVLVLVFRVGAAERHEFPPAYAQFLRVVAEVVLHQVHRKVVVTRRHRRMRGIKRGGADGLHGLGKTHAGGHEILQTFDAEERGVPLVEVPQIGFQAHCLDSLHAADAEQDFLLEAVLVVAAVELVRQAAVFPAIGLEVGIQQEEVDAAHGQFPDLCLHDAPLDTDGDNEPFAFVGADGFDGQLGKFLGWKLVDLLAVLAQGLVEVAVTVKQADAE